MSSLKIYLQDFLFFWKEDMSDLKKYLSEYKFHIGCIVDADISEKCFAKEGDAADIFDVFGGQSKVKINCVTGNLIIVSKQLSAYVRTEWMTEREECVWVTVPSQGGRSRLHVACVDFASSSNLDLFTQTLTSLSKTHANDTFLVVGCFPARWFSEEHQLIGTPRSKHKADTIQICSSVSLAGLAQFNHTMNENSTNCTAVFTSVPVTVTPCPHPFYGGLQTWETALEFSLNIDSSECCKTATDATGQNYANEHSGQREARREDVNASGDSSTITDRLVHKKWEDTTQLLPELIREKFQQTAKELQAVQEECGKMWKENESAKSECAQMEKMKVRLRTLEERALTHRDRSTSKTRTSGDSERTTNQGDSYKEALTGIKMAVIADNHPASTLGADMLKPIRSVLWEMLDTTPDPLPKVSLEKMISGVVHFTCEGEGAVKWLSRLNGTTVGDAKLRVVSAKDIPKPVKMAWKSRNDCRIDTAKVLNILQRYNPSLRTAEWKVGEVLVEDGNVIRNVHMDRVSADIIKTKNYSLYSGLERTSFKLLEDYEGKIGGPTSQKAAKVTPTADPQDPEGPRLSLQPVEVTVEEGAAGGH